MRWFVKMCLVRVSYLMFVIKVGIGSHVFPSWLAVWQLSLIPESHEL